MKSKFCCTLDCKAFGALARVNPCVSLDFQGYECQVEISKRFLQKPVENRKEGGRQRKGEPSDCHDGLPGKEREREGRVRWRSIIL